LISRTTTKHEHPSGTGSRRHSANGACKLATAITDYADWLDRQHGIDAERTLRLADTAASLRQDKLVVAFVAEFSRGKTELINALFFADHGQRLLPSDAGRTTMCPTELFANADEAPSLCLLPIETRRRERIAGATQAHADRVEPVLLDPADPRQLQESLKKLTETKPMAAVEAIELGLWDEARIPASATSCAPTARWRCRPGATPWSTIRIRCCRPG
jgi:hypothetical protein